jgi:two-component system, OmpR family, sensor histidine kinase QseC
MTRLFEPTLTRRVVLAVLVAFLLTWVVLLSFQYLEVRLTERQNPGLVQICEQIQDALRVELDAPGAQAIVAAIDRMSSGSRQRQNVPGSLLIQVVDRRQGRVLYASPALAGALLSGDPAHQTRQRLPGGLFEVAQRDTPRWSVRVAQAHIERAWILKSLAVDLIKYMLIALPFILLPVWLAVSRGLRPLRELSGRIAARGTDDLSAIGIEPKHAELKPIAAALDGLLARLTARMERERAFLQDAAHELRTPLAVISAQAHALAHSTIATEREEAGRHLAAAIDRASHLVHQLLALARLDIERAQVAKLVDLAQLVRQDLAGFAHAARTRNLELSMEGPDRLDIAIEVALFQSVLHNLVDNAIRYGHDGGQVVVELKPLSGGWSLAVSDDGPGIAQAEQALVFERFYRGTGHDAPGTGLGLAIVAQAAARLGGRVGLTAGIDGRGCQFKLTVRPHCHP